MHDTAEGHDPVDTIRIRPAQHVRAIGALGAAVFSMFLFQSDLESSLVCLPAIAVGLWVAFFMDVRADRSGIRIRRLFGVDQIEADDIGTIRYTDPVRSSVKNRTIGNTATLTIFGKDLEPSQMVLYESDSPMAAEFTEKANRLFGSADHGIPPEILDFAVQQDNYRKDRASRSIRAGQLPLLMVMLGTVLLYDAVQAEHGNNRWLEQTWAPPLCALAVVIGCVLLRSVWRRYQQIRDWEQYAGEIRVQLAQMKMSDIR